VGTNVAGHAFEQGPGHAAFFHGVTAGLGMTQLNIDGGIEGGHEQDADGKGQQNFQKREARAAGGALRSADCRRTT
jgi:hypothetical protein